MENIEVSEASEGVAEIRLKRPPVNALSGGLLDELGDAVRQLEKRGDVNAIVVWGGAKVFAAGADVNEFRPVEPEVASKVAARFRNALDALAAFPRPTIAAITGYALGGGLELALACDFRVAGDNARLGLPEINLGIMPGGGGTQRLARLVGASRAKDLTFSGRHVRAQEALEMGLVNRVVGPEEVYDTALQWAKELSRGAVVAMGLAKDAIDAGLELTLAEGLSLENERFAATYGTRDAFRGIESFIADGPGKATFEGN